MEITDLRAYTLRPPLAGELGDAGVDHRALLGRGRTGHRHRTHGDRLARDVDRSGALRAVRPRVRRPARGCRPAGDRVPSPGDASAGALLPRRGGVLRAPAERRRRRAVGPEGPGPGRPLYALLGGDGSDVPAYCSRLDAAVPTDELGGHHGRYAEEGFTAFETKVGGRSLDEDVRRVGDVREAIGPGPDLFVDANQSWTTSEAVRGARALAGHDVGWVEEPISEWDLDGHARVAEGFGLDVEYHLAGPAQGHPIAATRNSNFYELGLVGPTSGPPHAEPPVYDGYTDRLKRGRRRNVPGPQRAGTGARLRLGLHRGKRARRSPLRVTGERVPSSGPAGSGSLTFRCANRDP